MHFVLRRRFCWGAGNFCAATADAAASAAPEAERPRVFTSAPTAAARSGLTEAWPSDMIHAIPEAAAQVPGL